jgi:hypothetical protein
MKITSLTIYPVKSLKGISLERMPIDKRGPVFDREWMLVDRNNRFVSQRELAKLCLIETELTDFSQGKQLESARRLVLRAGERDISINIEAPAQGQPIEVKVWNDLCQAYEQDKNASSLLSEFLDYDVRLVRMCASEKRIVDPKYAPAAEDKDHIVGFADGFPLLVISDASLQDLNAKLEYPVEMNRFRPNLTFDGDEPYLEDKIKELQSADLTLALVKPCARCQITTIDQDSADTGKEPLRTLSNYRKIDGKVMFGQNAIVKELKAGAALHLFEPLVLR